VAIVTTPAKPLGIHFKQGMPQDNGGGFPVLLLIGLTHGVLTFRKDFEIYIQAVQGIPIASQEPKNLNHERNGFFVRGKIPASKLHSCGS
jgi:hypothetical protein